MFRILSDIHNVGNIWFDYITSHSFSINYAEIENENYVALLSTMSLYKMKYLLRVNNIRHTHVIESLISSGKFSRIIIDDELQNEHMEVIIDLIYKFNIYASLRIFGKRAFSDNICNKICDIRLKSLILAFSCNNDNFIKICSAIKRNNHIKKLTIGEGNYISLGSYKIFYDLICNVKIPCLNCYVIVNNYDQFHDIIKYVTNNINISRFKHQIYYKDITSNEYIKTVRMLLSSHLFKITLPTVHFSGLNKIDLQHPQQDYMRIIKDPSYILCLSQDDNVIYSPNLSDVGIKKHEIQQQRLKDGIAACLRVCLATLISHRRGSITNITSHKNVLRLLASSIFATRHHIKWSK